MSNSSSGSSIMKNDFGELSVPFTDIEVSEMLKSLANTAHEAIRHVGYANYKEREATAHKLIDDKLLELSKDLVLD